MQNLTQTMIELWQLACQGRGRPSCRVEDGHFVFTVSGNRDQWGELCQAAGVPSTATETTDGETLTMRWESHADEIFGVGGRLACTLDNYEMRPQQLWMGRMVQRSIEMGVPAVVEAGTGTGKSFAYAAVCMAMDKRLVISTSNKALQMQLYRKDIPFLSTLFPGKRVALVQGKNNYACRAKAEDMVSGALTFVNPDLQGWYAGTETGNVEEIPFATDWKELAEITADDRCLGRMCGRYEECFYYAAKEQRSEANVLICNHILLCMDQMYPGAGIVPGADVIVVDEAHKLADYARNVLGVEFRLSAVEKAIQRGDKYDADTGPAGEALRDFEHEIYLLQDKSRDPQIGLPADQGIIGGLELAAALNELAEELWRSDELPSNAEQVLCQKDADAIRSVAGMVEAVSAETAKGFVRWIDQSNRDAVTLHCAPYDVSEFIGRLAGFWTADTSTRLSASGEPVALDYTHCSQCHRKLTANTVAILDGKPYGPDCILKVDLFGDAERVTLAEWLTQTHDTGRTVSPTYEIPRTPVIFTSATIAAPDMSHFLRESGIPYALQMQVESPFDYKKNALLYVPNGATPDPNTENYLSYLIGDLRNLVQASRGGAFLLFTSYRMMNAAVNALRYEFERAGWPVYVQGELPKLEIAKRFREHGDGVLFATKSFFEGVSIDGDALRLVVIDKMPFEAPNPLNTAQEAALKMWAVGQGKSQREAEMYPFNHLRVPRMIIEIKQGVGRLIRTATDRGVMAVLDPRIRSKSYGRQMVLPSMPPARLVHSVAEVGAFFAERRPVLATPVVPTLPSNGKSNGYHKERALPVEKVLVRDEDGGLWA